MWCVIN